MEKCEYCDNETEDLHCDYCGMNCCGQCHAGGDYCQHCIEYFEQHPEEKPD